MATAIAADGPLIAISDAELLFSADFSRSGDDLVLKGQDGASLHVSGYFDSESPSALVAPSGAMLTGDVVVALAGPRFPGQYAQVGGAPSGGKQIGRVESLQGEATAQRSDGTVVTLKVGDPVFQGDVVQTAAGGKLDLVFLDGAVFTMSAGARMVLDNLVYNPGGSDNAMLFSLVQGTFAFVTGQIAPTGDMQIKTPVATMGIRGTTPTVSIDAQSGVVQFSILPDPGSDPNNPTVGQYVLMDLNTGAIIGSVVDTGSKWVMTSAFAPPLEIEKTSSDLLSDEQAIVNIGSAFSSVQNRVQQGQDPVPQNQQQNPTNQQDGSNTQNPGDVTGSIPGGPTGGGINTGGPENAGLNGLGGPGTQNGPGNPLGTIDPNNPGNPFGANPNTTPTNTNIGNNPPPAPTFTIIVGDGNDNVINGSPIRDIIFGGDGDDIIDGKGGNDDIFGQGGNDTLTGGDGNDRVFGGLGDDTLIAGSGAGDDEYDGGADNDTLTYASTSQGVTVNLVAGVATGPEVGNDTFVNIENFVGGSGNDLFIAHPSGSFSIDGGDGVDMVRIAGAYDHTTDDGGTEDTIRNVEIIDLNATDAVRVDITAADIAEFNDDGVIRVLGGPEDTIDVTGAAENDAGGQWIQTFAGRAGSLLGFVDHLTDGIVFDTYEFYDTGGNRVATAHVQQGIAINAEFDHVLAPGEVVTGAVSTQGESDSPNPFFSNYWHFNAVTGDVITVEGQRLEQAFDMSLWVFEGVKGPDDFAGGVSSLIDAGDSGFIAFGDDELPNPGPFGDPFVQFTAPSTGLYTIVVTNFLSGADDGDGRFPYTLTVNFAPVIDLAGAANATEEDTPLTISGIEITDVDAGQSALTVTLAVNFGALVLTNAQNVQFSDADGSDGSLTFSGAQAAINAALAQAIVYTPDADHNGRDTLSITATDQAGLARTETLQIAISPVNDAPVISGTASPVSYKESQAPKAISPSLALSDVDSATLNGATVAITGNFAAGQDVLGFVDQSGITGQYDADTGELTLSGQASLANYQAALRSVTYSNSSDDPSTLARTVGFQVNDGGSENCFSNIATVTLNVTAINDLFALDQFDSQAYNLNNGGTEWAANWTEQNDNFNGAVNGSPTQGDIYISHDPTTSAGDFQLTLTDNDNERGVADTIQRSVNLAGATAAMFTFDYRRVSMESGDDIQVYASSDGQNFALIGTIVGNGTDDSSYQAFSFDLTPYISANTTIRFAVDDGLSDGDILYVDNVKITYTPGGADPIILDLGDPGIQLTSLDNPVLFDLDADGTREQVGWTAGRDGILVSDLDQSGAIENGTEVLSPYFDRGDYRDALHALASFDSNGDGIVDARDSAFANLLVWTDANHDGVSQDGELADLSQHGIVSIDLDVQQVGYEIDGQRILAEGRFTLASGETRTYFAAEFDQQLGAGALHLASADIDFTNIAELRTDAGKTIDLRDGLPDSLTLSLQDVFHLAGQANGGGEPDAGSLLIFGDAGQDVVNLQGSTDPNIQGEWRQGGDLNIGNASFDVHNFTSGGDVLASVAVQTEVAVQVNTIA